MRASTWLYQYTSQTKFAYGVCGNPSQTIQSQQQQQQQQHHQQQTQQSAVLAYAAEPNCDFNNGSSRSQPPPAPPPLPPPPLHLTYALPQHEIDLYQSTGHTIEEPHLAHPVAWTPDKDSAHVKQEPAEVNFYHIRIVTIISIV